MIRNFFVIGLLVFGSLLGNERWIYYTSDKAPVEAFSPYSLLVLDSFYHPPLKPLKKQGKILLGYISLGEVGDYRSWFKTVKDEGILLEENKNWPGSYMVDLRDTRWRERLIKKIIPQVLEKGFDGLHFDTLDDAVYLENKDPKRYAGMVDAAVQTIKEIRKNYPNIPIMLQRAYPILLKVAGDVNFALAEDALTTYDFENKKYLMQPQEVVDEQLDYLRRAQKINPKLKLYALDYWYPDQTEQVKKIYRTDRENGLIPYVATIDLHKVIPEPK